MQCDETISHMVTAARSYFRTLRNACVTAGKIYYGSFEMLSWPYRTSNNIINMCFWLLDTCAKCSYFIEENIRPGAQRLSFEVKYEYVHRSTNISCAGGLRLGNFQTTGVWSTDLFKINANGNAIERVSCYKYLGVIRARFSWCEALGQWWRTYGTRARGGTHSPLCGHAHRRSSADLVRYQIGRGRRGQVAPKIGTATWKDTVSCSCL